MTHITKVTCKTCRGTKQARGMGGIMRDCKICKGLGQIELPIETSSPTEPVLVIDAPVGRNPYLEHAHEALCEGLLEPFTKEDEAGLVAELAKAGVNEIVTALQAPKKKEEKKVNPAEALGEMMGYTPFMVEAIMAETAMEPSAWRNKYGSIILDPLAVSGGIPGKQYLPGAVDRRGFRESVAMNGRDKIAPRKYDMMKAQDMAGKLAGID